MQEAAIPMLVRILEEHMEYYDIDPRLAKVLEYVKQRQTRRERNMTENLTVAINEIENLKSRVGELTRGYDTFDSRLVVLEDQLQAIYDRVMTLTGITPLPVVDEGAGDGHGGL